MKVMKKALLHEKEKAMQILTEKNIIQRLQHPFIVPLHWAFQSVLYFHEVILCRKNISTL
jgi:hypothetical protein